MSLESVRAFFAQKAPDIEVIELPVDTATVALAAQAHGVEPGASQRRCRCGWASKRCWWWRSGDSRLDNRKLKAVFGGKAKMLDAQTVLALTGHPVGGVCPFGLATPLPIYCDIGLRAFDEVLPAAGGLHTAVRIAPLAAGRTGRRNLGGCLPGCRARSRSSRLRTG